MICHMSGCGRPEAYTGLVQGARFAKWRSVISIPSGPSNLALQDCAYGLARYAAISQVSPRPHACLCQITCMTCSLTSTTTLCLPVLRSHLQPLSMLLLMLSDISLEAKARSKLHRLSLWPERHRCFMEASEGFTVEC